MHRGPVEGWGFNVERAGRRISGVVKGCEHPLPCLHVVVKRVDGRKLVDPFAETILARWSHCLLTRVNMICPDDNPILIDPVDRLDELKAAGWRDPLVEHLEAHAPGAVGVTGSLLYSDKHRDVDLIVYGEEASARALQALLALVAKGVARPSGVKEYSVVRREVGFDDWLLLSLFNPLHVSAYGRLYTIRLVSCVSPRRCPGLVARERVYARVHVIGRSSPPCTIPSCYRVKAGLADTLYTLRTSYACLPSHVLLEGVFILETGRGFTRLVPDGGAIRVQMLQA